MESHRRQEKPTYDKNPNKPFSMACNVAHEVGHLFSARHGQGDIMGVDGYGASVSCKYSDITLDMIRKLAHP